MYYGLQMSCQAQINLTLLLTSPVEHICAVALERERGFWSIGWVGGLPLDIPIQLQGTELDSFTVQLQWLHNNIHMQVMRVHRGE